MNKLLKKLLSPFSSAAYQQELRNSTNIRLRLQNRALESTCEYIENNMAHLVSVIGREKVLLKAISETKIDGLYCEFGVYKGYTLNFIQANTSNTIHGFDSFNGLPEFWIDGFDKDAFELPNTPQFSGNVKIHEGYYDYSLPIFLNNHKESIAFMHIDCDLYSSTKTIFDLCKDYLKTHGKVYDLHADCNGHYWSFIYGRKKRLGNETGCWRRQNEGDCRSHL